LPAGCPPRRRGRRVVRAAVAAALVGSVSACQFPDPYYVPVLPDPVYQVPTIAFDRTHENLRAIDGAFGPFAELARADGYRVRDFDVKFAPGCLTHLVDCAYWNALQEVNILAMVVPLTPLSDEEAAVLALWTVFGGSLLLVPDKEIQLVETLLQQFRIERRLGCPTNVLHRRSERNPGMRPARGGGSLPGGAGADSRGTSGGPPETRLGRQRTLRAQLLHWLDRNLPY
jgi:hypothetical protein